jgi:transposase
MSKKQAVYSPEFRQQMVDLVRAGRSASELAREFGCHNTSIAYWVRQADRLGVTPLSGAPLSASEREELAKLRKRVKQLETERDILSKATAWFANNGAPTPTSFTRS